MNCSRIVALLVTAFAASPVLACLWDYDTIKMERERFPEVLEMITGKFLRHSPELYQWRVEDRQQKLLQIESSPDRADWYDDLAVAHSKLGDHAKAIELMLEKEKQFPGLYKTRANLGTFYIFAGRLEEAAEQIELALKIDPNAHFGREVYQLQLVRYLLECQQDDAIRFPLRSQTDAPPIGAIGFARFLLHNKRPEDQDAEIKKATRAVLGMMHFANFESPVLLESLGDLLRYGGREDAKQLAARAYLKASYVVKDEAVRKAYRETGKLSLGMQLAENSTRELSLEALEAELAEEIAAGDAWYANIHADEKAWIAAGLNPDEEFTRKYHQSAPVATAETPARTATATIAIVAIVMLGVIWFWHARSRTGTTLRDYSASQTRSPTSPVE